MRTSMRALCMHVSTVSSSLRKRLRKGCAPRISLTPPAYFYASLSHSHILSAFAPPSASARLFFPHIFCASMPPFAGGGLRDSASTKKLTQFHRP
jgi:hypothetical protein